MAGRTVEIETRIVSDSNGDYFVEVATDWCVLETAGPFSTLVTAEMVAKDITAMLHIATAGRLRH